MEFHFASRQCGGSRDFHELDALPGGNCRKGAPQHSPDVIGALVAGKEHPADRYAVKRCPHVHEDDGCGRYEHRCMAHDCRGSIHSYCERDIVDGQLFCRRHGELKRRRAA